MTTTGPVYHDGGTLYVFATRTKGPAKLPCGVLVDAAAGAVGPEAPLASIAANLPYSDFKPLSGDAPAEVVKLVAAAELPQDVDL